MSILSLLCLSVVIGRYNALLNYKQTKPTMIDCLFLLPKSNILSYRSNSNIYPSISYHCSYKILYKKSSYNSHKQFCTSSSNDNLDSINITGDNNSDESPNNDNVDTESFRSNIINSDMSIVINDTKTDNDISKNDNDNDDNEIEDQNSDSSDVDMKSLYKDVYMVSKLPLLNLVHQQ